MRYTFWYIVLLTLYNGGRRIVHCDIRQINNNLEFINPHPKMDIRHQTSLVRLKSIVCPGHLKICVNGGEIEKLAILMHPGAEGKVGQTQTKPCFAEIES